MTTATWAEIEAWYRAHGYSNAAAWLTEIKRDWYGAFGQDAPDKLMEELRKPFKLGPPLKRRPK